VSLTIRLETIEEFSDEWVQVLMQPTFKPGAEGKMLQYLEMCVAGVLGVENEEAATKQKERSEEFTRRWKEGGKQRDLDAWVGRG
jgi:hypothetical protein